MQNTITTIIKTAVSSAVPLTLISLLSFNIHAAIIPADLSIEASIQFDDSIDGSFSTTPNAVQSGTMELVQGGVSEQTSVNNLSVSGNNPLMGNLQETGDGFTLAAQIAGRRDSAAEGFFFDFGLELKNLSNTTDYILAFQIIYNNTAFANPADDPNFDAFADSKANLERLDTAEELFFTDLTSDSLGDQIDGQDVTPASAGAELTDSDIMDVFITLNRNSTISLLGSMELAGANFLSNSGGFRANQDLSIALTRFAALNQPPMNVPAPSLVLLFAGAVLVLFRKTKFRKK